MYTCYFYSVAVGIFTGIVARLFQRLQAEITLNFQRSIFTYYNAKFNLAYRVNFNYIYVYENLKRLPLVLYCNKS